MLIALTHSAAAASSYTVLYTFSGGADGETPMGPLTIDKNGNLYGMTFQGDGTGCLGSGCGAIFKVTPSGKETTLYDFPGGADGGLPSGGVVADAAGNLFGTTGIGGSDYGGGIGAGVVFELSPGGVETVLYNFCSLTNCSDGLSPVTVLTNRKGKFYGTTFAGGGDNDGVAFRLVPGRSETVLHSFAGGADGLNPAAGLKGVQGNFYGTTEFGGGSSCPNGGCGTVFKITPKGVETILYAFKGGSDGASPVAPLIADGKGNLYGTTEYGGGSNCHAGAGGCGTIFKIKPNGTEIVLYAFKGGTTDGEYPAGGLIADEKGNLYGTTIFGGNGCAGSSCGFGIVFKLARDGTETVLYNLCSETNCSDGAGSVAGLVRDSVGNFYGTAENGGNLGGVCAYTSGCGTVFKLTNK